MQTNCCQLIYVLKKTVKMCLNSSKITVFTKNNKPIVEQL